MRIVFIGPPGAGKGTQAERLITAYRMAHLSTGDMLRAARDAKTEVGQKAEKYMSSGALVPDEIIVDIIAERLGLPDCRQGYLLDGFPRTIPQAEALRTQGVGLDCVLEIDVSDEEIIRRMSGRRVHLGSGRTYHVVFNPPKVEGKDDATGEPLIQRDDDKEETVKKRLAAYHAQTKPLTDFYSKWSESGAKGAPRYRKVSGIGSLDTIKSAVFAALS